MGGKSTGVKQALYLINYVKCQIGGKHSAEGGKITSCQLPAHFGWAGLCCVVLFENNIICPFMFNITNNNICTNPDSIAYEAKLHIDASTTKLKLQIIFLYQKKSQCLVVQGN